jgi:predicted transposase/invertase (TIGR01784 family)
MSQHIKLIDPAIDWTFKSIFGKHSDLLKNFLMTGIKWDYEPITELTFDNTEINKDYADDKSSKLDVKAILQDGMIINIEIQLSYQTSYIDRSLYYWSKLYEGQMNQSDPYSSLRPVVCVNILLKNHPKIIEKTPYNRYALLNEETHSKLTNKLSIHYIELEKFNGKWVDGDESNNWMVFLKNPEEATMHTQQSTSLSKALEELKWMSQDPAQRKHYEARCKFLRDQEEERRSAEEIGREEGREEGIVIGENRGIEKGIEKVVISMLKQKIDDSLIQSVTGFSQDDLNKLKNKI